MRETPALALVSFHIAVGQGDYTPGGENKKIGVDDVISTKRLATGYSR